MICCQALECFCYVIVEGQLFIGQWVECNAVLLAGFPRKIVAELWRLIKGMCWFCALHQSEAAAVEICQWHKRLCRYPLRFESSLCHFTFRKDLC